MWLCQPLVDWLSEWGDEYSVVMGWLRCSLSFSLLRSAIQCVHGTHSSFQHHVVAPPLMDLVRVEPIYL